MAEIKVIPLGAGREVGRSCVLISIGDVLVMCDCGMHMGYANHKMFPDFEFIAEGDLTNKIDAVLITHFHLDHVGSLPILTERIGYSGPLIMTAPTKSIAPLLLDDFAKIQSQRTSINVWGRDDVKNCMSKASLIELHETIKIKSKSGTEIKITSYYAGHVLGAVMFLIEAHGCSAFYTGDYNTSSDRHLSAAYVPSGIRPDVFITESTYGNKIRDSRRARERVFLETVYETVTKGGKVLIPVFAMGRAQELLILIETYWKRMNLNHIPIYFSAGMVGRANDYYKLHTSWTSPAFKHPSGRCAATSATSANFDFSTVSVFDETLLSHPGPLVLFSTPGMLHAGSSLKAFHHWCESDANTVILPGYCVAGTLGHEILTNESTTVTIDGQEVPVKCKAMNMPFSAHADARGILRLIQQLSPQAVVLVHGDYEKCMIPLMERIVVDCKIPCYAPLNGHSQSITVRREIPLVMKLSFSEAAESSDLKKCFSDIKNFAVECQQQLQQQPDDEEDCSGQVVKRQKDWWSSWGVNIESLSVMIKDLKPTGPCDIDCGCDADHWSLQINDRITGNSSPKSRYIPIPQGTQNWGINDTTKLIVSVPEDGEEEQVFDITRADHFVELKELSNKKHSITFNAIIKRDPSCTLPPPHDDTAFLSAIAKVLTPEFDSLPLPIRTSLRVTADSICLRSITILVYNSDGVEGIKMIWSGIDVHIATRLHEVISDTLGVAL